MACFLAPAAEAIVTTVVQKKIEKKERMNTACEADKIYSSEDAVAKVECQGNKISWSRKLKWLNTMLWGGVALLCVEHMWHGEVVPWPPFLTAMNTPSEIVPMLKEIALYGTAMAAVITAVWFVVTLIADKLIAGEIISLDEEIQKQ